MFKSFNNKTKLGTKDLNFFLSNNMNKRFNSKTTNQLGRCFHVSSTNSASADKVKTKSQHYFIALWLISETSTIALSNLHKDKTVSQKFIKLESVCEKLIAFYKKNNSEDKEIVMLFSSFLFISRKIRFFSESNYDNTVVNFFMLKVLRTFSRFFLHTLESYKNGSGSDFFLLKSLFSNLDVNSQEGKFLFSYKNLPLTNVALRNLVVSAKNLHKNILFARNRVLVSAGHRKERQYWGYWNKTRRRNKKFSTVALKKKRIASSCRRRFFKTSRFLKNKFARFTFRRFKQRVKSKRKLRFRFRLKFEPRKPSKRVVSKFKFFKGKKVPAIFWLRTKPSKKNRSRIGLFGKNKKRQKSKKVEHWATFNLDQRIFSRIDHVADESNTAFFWGGREETFVEKLFDNQTVNSSLRHQFGSFYNFCDGSTPQINFTESIIFDMSYNLYYIFDKFCKSNSVISTSSSARFYSEYAQTYINAITTGKIIKLKNSKVFLKQAGSFFNTRAVNLVSNTVQTQRSNTKTSLTFKKTYSIFSKVNSKFVSSKSIILASKSFAFNNRGFKAALSYYNINRQNALSRKAVKLYISQKAFKQTKWWLDAAQYRIIRGKKKRVFLDTSKARRAKRYITLVNSLPRFLKRLRFSGRVIFRRITYKTSARFSSLSSKYEVTAAKAVAEKNNYEVCLNMSQATSFTSEKLTPTFFDKSVGLFLNKSVSFSKKRLALQASKGVNSFFLKAFNGFSVFSKNVNKAKKNLKLGLNSSLKTKSKLDAKGLLVLRKPIFSVRKFKLNSFTAKFEGANKNFILFSKSNIVKHNNLKRRFWRKVLSSKKLKKRSKSIFKALRKNSINTKGLKPAKSLDKTKSSRLLLNLNFFLQNKIFNAKLGRNTVIKRSFQSFFVLSSMYKAKVHCMKVTAKRDSLKFSKKKVSIKKKNFYSRKKKLVFQRKKPVYCRSTYFKKTRMIRKKKFIEISRAKPRFIFFRKSRAYRAAINGVKSKFLKIRNKTLKLKAKALFFDTGVVFTNEPKVMSDNLTLLRSCCL